ncbi:MAG: ferrous iron transport protein B [Verrucomicrobia bacterium]|nr:ferrous iron transport protein B [Verrucomicrobiota bacterium]
MNPPSAQPPSGTRCAVCPAFRPGQLVRLGVSMERWDQVVALAGNPNTGKSTVFNLLTGLRQHTGNWPGKTVTRAEGGFEYGGGRFKLVDLPGTYSLLTASPDEEVARNFLLFGAPDVTLVVVDATRLERNLCLALQILEITPRVIVVLNLMDQARRQGLQVDERRLARDLGVPVVPLAARYREGTELLLRTIHDVASGKVVGRGYRLGNEPPELSDAVDQLELAVGRLYPGLPNARWVARRLLDGDDRIIRAVRDHELAELIPTPGAEGRPPEGAPPTVEPGEVLELAQSLRRSTGSSFHERLVETLYAEAARLAGRAVVVPGGARRFDLDHAIDRLVTSRVWGYPLMLLLFTAVFWLTISGANIPSGWLGTLLLDRGYGALHSGALYLGFPNWLSGFLIDGVYRATAWVVSVMLPPMAIFFPLFTFLEDFGYLPRVAFNLDNAFRRSGAHGKQALSMMMGFGCNAAGIVATRIIDSPRERLIAMLTNNFALCNGRWPTQILIASLFIGALAPPYLAGVAAAAAVVAVALLGVLLSLIVSRFLSRTVLKGEVSTFSLELPPYRPPKLWQVIYTSLIDRTLYVLWRAIVFAAPAGAVIWLLSNLSMGDVSLAERLVNLLNPIGLLMGLNGVILLAYLIAIPANEIVIPTVLMLTVLTERMTGLGSGAGVMLEFDSLADTMKVFEAGGWTLLTGINLMLFSLIHNPCSTTLYTLYRESGSLRWTLAAAILPLAMGFIVTFFIAQIWQLIAR